MCVILFIKIDFNLEHYNTSQGDFRNSFSPANLARVTHVLRVIAYVSMSFKLVSSLLSNMQLHSNQVYFQICNFSRIKFTFKYATSFE